MYPLRGTSPGSNDEAGAHTDHGFLRLIRRSRHGESSASCLVGGRTSWRAVRGSLFAVDGLTIGLPMNEPKPSLQVDEGLCERCREHGTPIDHDSCDHPDCTPSSDTQEGGEGDDAPKGTKHVDTSPGGLRRALANPPVPYEELEADLDRANERASRLEREFGHLRDKPLIYGTEATKIVARASRLEKALERVVGVRAWARGEIDKRPPTLSPYPFDVLIDRLDAALSPNTEKAE
jgi:hypothetical protein